MGDNMIPRLQGQRGKGREKAVIWRKGRTTGPWFPDGPTTLR